MGGKSMRVIGHFEQQAIDRLWQQRTGLPLLILMENAAAAVVKRSREMVDPAATVLVLAGKGNNGGDAFASARLLAAAGYRVVCRELFPDAPRLYEVEANRQAYLGLGHEITPLTAGDFDRMETGSLIIDGIFGTGFRADRPFPEPVRQASLLTAAARQRGALVLAIDIPSGVDADSGHAVDAAFCADVTVTFCHNKIGLCGAPGRFLAGRVLVEPIGVPKSWIDDLPEAIGLESGVRRTYQTDVDDVRAVRPVRAADSHKGHFGRVLVLGGSPGMPGAVLLAATAAARSGAGLVDVAVPETIAATVLAARPECLLHTLPEGKFQSPEQQTGFFSQMETLLRSASAVVAGMGAGQSEWLRSALPQMISGAGQLILDADALNQIARDPDCYFGLLRERAAKGLAPAILTPHPGEFGRLLPDCCLNDRQEAARTLSAACSSVVVLKGAATVVAEPGGTAWINPTGNHGLAKGGSGDVLAGLIAGLLAQGPATAEAAVAAVYLHGLAADLAASRMGHRTILAGDVINAMGDALRQVGWEPS
ncbi:MAG: NAD(P)H-hydrate dehydratase [Saccharofermentanales bacterium]|jgi:hydroxyethylthiazole kinase-like uncharacterized protein yjeF|nr:NAD(P)H-hydrate dehydratase [Clostridiaceae bacterium]